MYTSLQTIRTLKSSKFEGLKLEDVGQGQSSIIKSCYEYSSTYNALVAVKV